MCSLIDRFERINRSRLGLNSFISSFTLKLKMLFKWKLAWGWAMHKDFFSDFNQMDEFVNLKQFLNQFSKNLSRKTQKRCNRNTVHYWNVDMQVLDHQSTLVSTSFHCLQHFVTLGYLFLSQVSFNSARANVNSPKKSDSCTARNKIDSLLL